MWRPACGVRVSGLAVCGYPPAACRRDGARSRHERVQQTFTTHTEVHGDNTYPDSHMHPPRPSQDESPHQKERERLTDAGEARPPLLSPSCGGKKEYASRTTGPLEGQKPENTHVQDHTERLGQILQTHTSRKRSLRSG